MENLDIQKIMIQIPAIAGALYSIYGGLIFILPPEYAKKLKPIGKLLNFLANTPGGVQTKEKNK